MISSMLPALPINLPSLDAESQLEAKGLLKKVGSKPLVVILEERMTGSGKVSVVGMLRVFLLQDMRLYPNPAGLNCLSKEFGLREWMDRNNHS